MAGLKTIGLYKIFYQRGGGVIEVLRNINLEISEGEFVSLVGPSGCGKTTFLRILHGLIKPSLNMNLLRRWTQRFNGYSTRAGCTVRTMAADNTSLW